MSGQVVVLKELNKYISHVILTHHRHFCGFIRAHHTFEVVPGYIFQRLIQEDHWEGNLQHHNPLGPSQGRHLEDQLEDRETLASPCIYCKHLKINGILL